MKLANLENVPLVLSFIFNILLFMFTRTVDQFAYLLFSWYLFKEYKLRIQSYFSYSKKNSKTLGYSIIFSWHAFEKNYPINLDDSTKEKMLVKLPCSAIKEKMFCVLSIISLFTTKNVNEHAHRVVSIHSSPEN